MKNLIKMITHKFSFPQKRIIQLCFLIFPLFFAVPLCLDLFNSERSIFPTSEFGNRIDAFTDRDWNGSSTIDKFNFDNNILTFGYTLHDGATIPLVFILISLDSEGTFRDFSTYERVLIRIRDSTMSQTTLFIKTFLPGVSLMGRNFKRTYRPNQYTLHINQGIQEYEIPLNEFITPQWWLQELKRTPISIPSELYNRVMSFDLQFNPYGSDNTTGKKETINIEKIILFRNPSMITIVLFSILCIYEVIIIMLMFRTRLWKKGFDDQIIPKQQHLEIPNFKEQELEKINKFLQVHYNDPGISTHMVSSAIEIPQTRIFKLLKENYNLTFKEIINRMRIKEAKHLLRESELRITDIALTLGFNELSYFNRIFKRYEGITPSRFRKDQT